MSRGKARERGLARLPAAGLLSKLRANAKGVNFTFPEQQDPQVVKESRGVEVS